MGFFNWLSLDGHENPAAVSSSAPFPRAGRWIFFLQVEAPALQWAVPLPPLPRDPPEGETPPPMPTHAPGPARLQEAPASPR